MITWQKDGEDVHEDVEFRETLPNQKGTFQKRSILKVPAEDQQKYTYTCVIPHNSLGEELVLPVSERRILRGGGSGGGLVIVKICVPVFVLLLAVSVGMTIFVKLRGRERSHIQNTDFIPSPHNSTHFHLEASLFQKHSPSREVLCHAKGFFPKSVNITWRKDGEDVHEDVELRETLPNQGRSFQKRSILNVPAEALQKHTYTCVIQHSSLGEELVLPVSERRILRGGGSGGGSGGATVGIIVGVIAGLLVLVAVRIVVWMKMKKSDFRAVPCGSSFEGDSSSSLYNLTR